MAVLGASWDTPLLGAPSESADLDHPFELMIDFRPVGLLAESWRVDAPATGIMVSRERTQRAGRG